MLKRIRSFFGDVSSNPLAHKQDPTFDTPGDESVVLHVGLPKIKYELLPTAVPITED